MVKPDGVRFRVLGSYSGIPHKNLLSYAATALFTMLVFSGLNHLAIFSTAHFKKVISDLDEKLALLSDWRVDFRTLDIKNFYAEVQRKGLEPKLIFIKEKFRRRNRTSFVSVPKSKTGKTLSPHPGQDMTGKYITMSIHDIVEIVCFASLFAFFKIGFFVIRQISGLPTG
jgi:hypothetical protein